MKTRSMIWVLLTGAMLVSAAVSVASADSAEQAVTAAEDQFAKALQANNAELFGTMLTDKYVNTDGEGTVLVGKDANVADQKLTTFTSLEVTDLKVTVYGDAAVATGTYAVKGTYKGKAFDGRGRYTDTWVKQNGKWLCAATHLSRLPKRKSGA